MSLFNSKTGKRIFRSGVGTILEEVILSQIPIVDTLESVLNICRDIKSDRLIQEKELAEIEARLNAYTQYNNFHTDILNKSYDLEQKELELIQIVTNRIVLLFEIVEKLEESSTKFKVYIEQINRYQNILEKMVTGSGKYFNEKIIEVNKISIPEFIRYTEIGSRKKLNNMKEAEYV